MSGHAPDDDLRETASGGASWRSRPELGPRPGQRDRRPVVIDIHGVDKLELAKSVFKSLDHFPYDASTGALVFEPSAFGLATKFATLAPHLPATLCSCSRAGSSGSRID